MINLVNKNDFVGQYYLEVLNETDFNTFISQFQENILLLLFGAEVYEDMENNISDIKYQNLINGGVYYDNIYGKKELFKGLKAMLIPYIFSEYIKHQRLYNTVTGTVTNNNENSIQCPTISFYSKVYENFNAAINYYNSAYRYMYVNSNLFPEFIVYHVVIPKRNFFEKSQIK